jgi:hypothetical protein
MSSCKEILYNEELKDIDFSDTYTFLSLIFVVIVIPFYLLTFFFKCKMPFWLIIPVIANSICVGIYSSVLLYMNSEIIDDKRKNSENKEKFSDCLKKRHLFFHILPAIVCLTIIPLLPVITEKGSSSIVMSCLFMVVFILSWLIFPCAKTKNILWPKISTIYGNPSKLLIIILCPLTLITLITLLSKIKKLNS